MVNIFYKKTKNSLKAYMERRDYLKKIKILIVLIVIFSIAVPLYFGGKGFISPILNKSSIGEVFAKGNSIRDEELIARAINGEARGEPYEGQVAVGAVILNRVKDPRFPNTIAGVIYQPMAFTAVSDGQINVPIDPDSTILKAARDALNGWDPTNGCVYYWNPETSTSDWIWSRTIVKKIGKHNFGK